MRHVTHAVTIIMALAVIALGINDTIGKGRK